MTYKRWICLFLFVTASVLAPAIAGHSVKTTSGFILADGTAPPPPPIKYDVMVQG